MKISSVTKISYEDPRLIQAIEAFRQSGKETGELEEFGISLLRIRVELSPKESTTLSITYNNKFFSSFGARCYNEPGQIVVASITTGSHELGVGGVELTAGTDAGFDVAFWNTHDAAWCPFDFGCFSNLTPLTMTFEPSHNAGSPELDMIIVGQTHAFGQAPATVHREGRRQGRCALILRAGDPSGALKLEAPDPEVPEPLGDPGWVQVTAKDANVSVFEDVSPIQPAAIWEEGKVPSALHGVVGTVIRRGPFALQIWVGDGSPRRVVGLRPFNAAGMFKIQGIFNSLERRTILYGVEIDIADLGGEAYAEFDMGVCSKDKPLLIELDNVTPAEAVATLNVVFASVPVDAK